MNRVANPVNVKIKVPLMIACLRDIVYSWLVFIYTYSKRRLDRTKKQCYPNIGKYPSNLLGIRGEGEYVKLSTKGRYGLRAMIDLARYSEEEPVSISSIAARQDISERYLEQLMGLLKKAGLVQSIRGATGGYILTRSAGEISVGDVLRALEIGRAHV